MYVDLAGLARYKSDFGAWARGALLPKDAAAARVRTAKAGAVSFVPVQRTPLDVSVDFMFSETPPASGDKSPSNPSTITGVSEVNLWLAGKNVNRTMPYYGFTDGVKVNREVTFTANQDGSVTANGTATGGDAICSLLNTNNVTNYGTSIGVGTWRLSGCPSGGSNSTYAVQPILSGGYGSISYDYGSGGSIVVTKSGAGVGIILRVASGYNAQNLVFCPQIELGTTATSYEQPVEKQKFALPLGSTYYGGTLDAASGVMTVTHSGMTLNGDTYLSTGIFDEQSDVYGVGFYPDPERLMTLSDSSDAACSILPVAVGTGAKNYPCAYLANNAMGIRLQFSKTSLGLGDGVEASEVRTAVKAFLAQHPGFIVWPVASPAAVQLTPTEILSLTQSSDYDPRVNTVYSDQQAVQVGYLKHPSAASADLRNALVSLGGGV